MSDFDSPWKEALDRWFEAFVALFSAEVHRRIDWSRGWKSLDTELLQTVRDADLGKRLADKLVQVSLLDGSAVRLLVHIEVQGRAEDDFARRMFVYHYRIFDTYNDQVISLAVLTDDTPDWRPNHFGYELGGCRLDFTFPIVKLLDFAVHRDMLEASANPFAVVVLAHLATRETRHDSAARYAGKLRLVRGLYERGWSREDVLELIRVIDWMMDLPPALQQVLRQDVEEIEKGMRMPYVTSFERLARQEGKAEGKAEMLLLALARRFQTTVPEEIAAQVRGAADPSQLDRWLNLVFDSATLAEFQQKMQA